MRPLHASSFFCFDEYILETIKTLCCLFKCCLLCVLFIRPTSYSLLTG